MNLLDSHDTARLLWTLTPGAETRAAKEQNAANVAAGKQRLRLASLIQYTIPGAPTVYYGDEVGVTGDDDPDDRRTYPWADPGGNPDTALLAHYTALAAARRTLPGSARRATSGSSWPTTLRGVARATAGRPARRRRSSSSTAATRRAPSRRPGRAAACRDGVAFTPALRRRHRRSARVVAAARSRSPSRRTRAVLLATGDRRPDAARRAAPRPRHRRATASVALTWNAVAGAAVVRRLPQPGHGRRLRQGERLAGRPATSFTDTGLPNARRRTTSSRRPTPPATRARCRTRSTAMPHYAIGWANLQWPPTMTHTISAVNRTDNVYGQVWIDGVTSQPGADAELRAQLGFGPDGSNPDGNAAWTVGRRRASTSTPATTTSSSRACCPSRAAPSTTPSATRRPAAATGSTPTSTGSANGYSAGAGRAADGQPERRHDRPRDADRAARRRRPSPARIELGVGRRRPATPTLYGYEVRALRVRRRPVHDARARHRTRPTPTRPSPRARPTTTSSARSTRRSTAPATSAPVSGDGGAARRSRSCSTSRCRRRPTAPAGRCTSRASSTGSTAAGPQWDPARRRADPRRRDALDDHAHGHGGDPARVQVRARRLGPRREGRRLRRDRQPPADAVLRRRPARRPSTTPSRTGATWRPAGTEHRRSGRRAAAPRPGNRPKEAP